MSVLHPFKFQASDEDLADLKRRIAATKWPKRETVSDATQGVTLATMQKLAHYWQTEHNWRKAEGGSEVEQLSAVRHQHRRAGYPFHPRPFEASQRLAGHFAAWEQPQAIVEDLRAGFRSLR
jgi:hypothetical protein